VPAPPPPDTAHVAAVDLLVDEVAGLLRMVHALKAQVTSRSAHGLLFPLCAAGPLRLTALAEAVHADPSTTSRQVGELVRDELVRREPDPDDRRAVLLVVTDAGHDAVQRLREQRNAALAEALGDWTSEEIATFTASFRRFTAGLAQTLGGSAGAPATPCPNSPEDR
jgi:DNA-binding MarR family transcriptional regulator